MALLVNVVPFVYLIVRYGCLYEGEISGYMCVAIGVSYQAYIALDNCDGK